MFRSKKLRAWANEARHAYYEGLRYGQDKHHVPKNIPNTKSAEVAYARGVKDATRKTNPVRTNGSWVELPIDLWQEILARKEKPGFW